MNSVHTKFILGEMCFRLRLQNHNSLTFNVSEYAHLASQDRHIHLTSQNTHTFCVLTSQKLVYLNVTI